MIGSTGLMNREEWVQRAACAASFPEIFFPTVGASIEDALRVCGGCPVRIACLKYALDHNEIHGVWGGVSSTDRLKYRRVL